MVSTVGLVALAVDINISSTFVRVVAIFISALEAVAVVSGYTLGNPLEPATTIGPMANKRFADTVRSQIDEAVAAGATAHIARFAEDDGGTYLTPQILTGVGVNNITSLNTVLASQEWDSMIGKLLDYVDNLEVKKVKAKPGFQM